jgi:hypothetical protein
VTVQERQHACSRPLAVLICKILHKDGDPGNGLGRPCKASLNANVLTVACLVIAYTVQAHIQYYRYCTYCSLHRKSSATSQAPRLSRMERYLFASDNFRWSTHRSYGCSTGLSVKISTKTKSRMLAHLPTVAASGQAVCRNTVKLSGQVLATAAKWMFIRQMTIHAYSVLCVGPVGL